MAELLLVEEMQQYFVDQGVAQFPSLNSTTPQVSLTIPSVWLAPRDGAPRPRDGENVTISLVDTQLGSTNVLEAWLEESFVDVIVVARHAATAKLTHRVIRNLIHPIEGHGGRKMWMMGALLVELSTVWTGEQPLAMDDAVYARKAGYRFQCRRKALAGTPDLP